MSATESILSGVAGRSLRSKHYRHGVEGCGFCGARSGALRRRSGQTLRLRTLLRQVLRSGRAGTPLRMPTLSPTFGIAVSQPLHLQAATEYCLPPGQCGVELLGVALEEAPQMQDDKYYAYRSFDYGQTWQCLEDPAAPPVAPLPPTEIPEPATWLLMISGLAGLAYLVERRQAHQGRTPTPLM